MADKEHFEVELIAEALTRARGWRSVAAKILKCSPSTVTNYINRYPELAGLVAVIDASNKDYVESKLFANISKGKEASIFFFLKSGPRTGTCAPLLRPRPGRAQGFAATTSRTA